MGAKRAAQHIPEYAKRVVAMYDKDGTVSKRFDLLTSFEHGGDGGLYWRNVMLMGCTACLAVFRHTDGHLAPRAQAGNGAGADSAAPSCAGNLAAAGAHCRRGRWRSRSQLVVPDTLNRKEC